MRNIDNKRRDVTLTSEPLPSDQRTSGAMDHGVSTLWDVDPSDQIAEALRFFFVSHTLDPLTGEVHTVH